MFKISDEIRKDILIILSESTVKGSEAELLVNSVKLIQSDAKDNIYEIPDNIRNFVIRLIQDFPIKGKQAPKILEIFVALNKGIESQPHPIPVGVTLPDVEIGKKGTKADKKEK